jgi:hypothetical protein
MVQAPTKTLTLEEFLQLPETKRASQRFVRLAVGMKESPSPTR